jgi:beta-lactamase regulating signal transducer with metallopeptidase domain
MIANFFAAVSDFTGSNVSMMLLLAKATIILVLALGITVVMQRASAGARHLVWLVTVAALLFVPALTAWAPLPVRVLPAVKSIAKEYSPLSNTKRDKSVGIKSEKGDEDVGVTALNSTNSEAVGVTAPAPAISGSTLMSGISVLFLIWAAVVLVITASLGLASLAVHRIVNRARPLDTEDWLTPLWEVSDRLELDEPPRLLRSEDAKMPFACGLLTPTIVLPAECDDWSLDRRRAVLLHELAHVRRHDLVGHTLGRLACAVYWFHPLVWTAAKQLRSESERACDDLALSCGARATDYAEHLLDIVTSVRRDATPSVALAMARRKEFEGRMLAILDPELRHGSPTRRQSATLIGGLALISIVVGAAAPAPRLAQMQESVAAAAEKPDLSLMPHPQVQAKAYPDSREIIGGSKIHVNTQTNTVMSEHTSTNLSERVSTAAGESVRAAMSTPAAMLTALIKGAPQGAGKDSDDRPGLLAKVLATDTSPSLRRIAAWGLSEYADKQVASDALANALRRDSNADVREMAAWALADGHKSTAVIDALSTALRGDASPQVRAISAWALGNIGDRSVGPVLAAALSDASPSVRRRAAWAMGSAEVKQAPPQLIALLKDTDPEVRQLAAWSLYQIEDPAAIPALESALRSEPNKDLQVAYIKALAATGERSVDALKSLLESKDPEIRTIAVKALAGGNATGPWPWPWPEPRPYP